MWLGVVPADRERASWADLVTFKMNATYDPEIPLLGGYLQNAKDTQCIIICSSTGTEESHLTVPQQGGGCTKENHAANDESLLWH